ncbi:MAG: redoxin domain-containing protein [Planctomycetes bacterium]|nr:redoxin domain-containing protein [Planctomycetota bacterium]MCB9891718.1 redoxin domain-containing protein [Planctomycetota bacterium]
MRLRFLAFLLVVFPPSPVNAQDEPSGDAPDKILEGHSFHGQVFNEGPRQSAYLMGGTGNVHFPVTTRDEEAQRFFDQGIGQLHGFWYFESERSFRQAALLDPEAPMFYLGMALSNPENYLRARDFLAEAWKRIKNANEKERLWIEAYAAFYNVDDGYVERAARRALREKVKDEEAEPARDEKRKRGRTLVRRLEELSLAHPDDIEIKAILANQIWLNMRYGETISSHLSVHALQEQIFAVNPMHPAHHYRIHLWDNENAKYALPSAARSGQTSPGIAHQWHMGGHIFAKLHRHQEAAWQQEASARVDHAHMMRDRVVPYLIHNYGHNNEWLTRSLNLIGRVDDALSLAHNLIELPRHPKLNAPEKRGSISNYGRARLLLTFQSYRMWDALLAAGETFYLEPSENLDDEAERHGWLGVAAYLTGQPERAQEHVTELESILERLGRERHEAVDAAERDALAASKKRDEIVEAMEAKLAEFAPRLERVRDQIARVRGYGVLVTGQVDEGEKALADLRSIQWMERCDIEVLARRFEKALTTLDRRKEAGVHEVPWLARKVLALQGRIHELESIEEEPNEEQARKHAKELEDRRAELGTTFETLRTVGGYATLDAPLLHTLRPIAAALGLPEDWRLPRPVPEDAGDRPELDSLGPFRWSPTPAKPWELVNVNGGRGSLADYAGKPVLLIHYLGFGCTHCVEQLEVFAPRMKDFEERGIQLVTIGTDTLSDMRDSMVDLPASKAFRFPLYADPEMRSFRDYRAFDDFEDQPLHGTYLIDGDGLVRWMDISYEPFVEVDFLLRESERLLKLSN